MPLPKPLVEIQINFTEIFLVMPSIKIALIAPLRQKKAARAIAKKYFKSKL